MDNTSVEMTLLNPDDVPNGRYLAFFRNKNNGHCSLLGIEMKFNGHWRHDLPMYGEFIGVIPCPEIKENGNLFSAVFHHSKITVTKVN